MKLIMQKIKDIYQSSKMQKVKDFYHNHTLLMQVLFSVIFITFIIELLNNNIILVILPNRLLLNFILVICVYSFFICITNKVKASLIISNILLFGLAFANYSVTSLRGTPLSVLDILSIGTGLSIADTYTLIVNPYLVFAIIFFILLIYLNCRTNYKTIEKNRKNIITRLLVIVFVPILCVLISTTGFIKIFFLKTNLWIPSKEYHANGFLASFVKQINDLIIRKPENYSIDKVEEIYYANIESKATSVDANVDVEPTSSLEEEKPNIIVIMNESFSDMRVHHTFQTNEEFMPYFKSIYNNTIHGTVHTSVYGGKTPNSEWEFLTNNSMAYFSYGSVPYQQYIRDNCYSLVSTLEAQGYSSSAIHTWYKTGYRRCSVYPLFGFDSFLSYDDVKDDVQLIRNYPSDLSTYELLIKTFEERNKEKPFFNFTITMQNHSGYDYDGDNFTPTISLVDIPDCPRIEQYLSLVKLSDDALKYLINYFENVDEKTIILFFGDHQPPYIEQEFWDYINQDKTDSLEDAEKGYLTPYFIWANYDLEDHNVPDISLNYLSTLLLDVAGLESTPYQNFLKNMQKEIPVITGHGYMDKTGTYHDFKEETEYTPWIRDYEIIEYNNMFGRKNIYKEMFELQRTGE